jgi:hypothetical protein
MIEQPCESDNARAGVLVDAAGLRRVVFTA